MRVFYALAFLLGIFARPLVGQAPAFDPTRFLIALDTANIAPDSRLGPSVYLTWVYALTAPTSPPSSAVLVAWDCATHQVKRIAQVKYQWRPDSLGVDGPVQMVDHPWQAVSDERMYALVCKIGPTHADESQAHPTYPDSGEPGPAFKES